MSGFIGLAFIALVLWCLCSAAGRAATGHFHGGRGMSHTRAMHEAGHYVAGRAVGASVAMRSDGDVDARGLPNAKAQIVFLLAGGIAAGTGAGCPWDYANARRALQEYPPGERDRIWARAQAEAQRIVSSRRGEIRRVAGKLERR